MQHRGNPTFQRPATTHSTGYAEDDPGDEGETLLKLVGSSAELHTAHGGSYSDNVSMTLMFMAASSAARYLNTYGSATFSTPLAVLQLRHTTRLSAAVAAPTPMGAGMSVGESRLPHSRHTSAMCLSEQLCSRSCRRKAAP
jgi:hypothetical protein